MAEDNASWDLALFKLEKSVSPRAKYMKPICLPLAKDFVEPDAGTVAGWGFQYRECQTDFWGPKRFSPCDIHWVYQGENYLHR